MYPVYYQNEVELVGVRIFISLVHVYLDNEEALCTYVHFGTAIQ